MSGGHFDYKQYDISEIAGSIEELVQTNEYDYSKETIQEFQNAVQILRKAYVYTQRIDWLVSADDGEETFHKRLKEELDKIEVDK
jgi:hypothetical protein